eukprot:873742-Lingulodinium_polyedra.AAC.1
MATVGATNVPWKRECASGARLHEEVCEVVGAVCRVRMKANFPAICKQVVRPGVRCGASGATEAQ